MPFPPSYAGAHSLSRCGILQGERTVRLFESVLRCGQHPKKLPQKFLCHLRRLMLMLPGSMTFRHLSRYSPYHEKTFARWLARDVDFVSLNHAAIVGLFRTVTSTSSLLTRVSCPKAGCTPTASTCSGTGSIAKRSGAWRVPHPGVDCCDP